MDFLVPGIIIVVSIGIIILLVKLGKKVSAKKQKLHKDYALSKGLKHTTSKSKMITLNKISGQLGGCEFMFSEEFRGDAQVSYVEFFNCPFTFDFKIGKKNLLNKASEKLGKKTDEKVITFGDEEFDKLFLFKSNSEEEFNKMLNYNVQNNLKTISNDLKSIIHCKDGTITYSIHGGIGREKDIKSNQQVIEFIVQLIEKAN